MSYLSRTALIVQTKAPYTTWANSVLPGGPQHTPHRTVYLTEDDAADGDAVVRAHFDEIFDHELYSWNEDRAAWPRMRTWKMFREWFDVEVVEPVVDLDDVKPEDG